MGIFTPKPKHNQNTGGALQIYHPGRTALVLLFLIAMNLIWQEFQRRRFQHTYDFLPKRYAFWRISAPQWSPLDDLDKKVQIKLGGLNQILKSRQLLLDSALKAEVAFRDFDKKGLDVQARTLNWRRARKQLVRAQRLATQFGYGLSWEAQEARKILQVATP